MADFDDVVRLAGSLPGVTESLSYGTPALKVGTTAFCRLWGDRDFRAFPDLHDDILVIFCTLERKSALLAASDGSLFTTAHYDSYGAVLVNLNTVQEVTLSELLHDSYQLRAPAPRPPRRRPA